MQIKKLLCGARKRLTITLIVMLMILLGVIYILYMEEQGNFYCVTLNEAYRSAQLDSDELVYYIQKYKIKSKSILNLRGAKPKKSWYKDEMEVCKQYNVKHYDLRLSAQREPGKEDIERLLTIFEVAPRPILIHCQGGADRSGLVAAMWKLYVDKESKSEARKQLSIFYGHIPFGPTSAMDEFFEKWSGEVGK